MVERNELITVCRQVGDMMEAGVDILRITRVLRAQTENPRLLQLYDALDHDMTMGHSLADAMSHAPDVFSPFMVLMVQQGEARNDLAGSFFKIADFVQKDGELSPDSTHDSSLQMHDDGAMAAHRVLDNRMSAPTAPLTVIALDGLIDRLQTFALRSLTVVSGLSLSLAGVWWSVEMTWLDRHLLYPTAFSVSAIFMGFSGVLIQRRIKSERRREARCSFCGRAGTEGDELQRAPRFAGAAICSRCAAIAARQSEEHEAHSSGAHKAAKSAAKPAKAPTARGETVDETKNASPSGTTSRDLQNGFNDADATSTSYNASQNGSGAAANAEANVTSSTRNGVQNGATPNYKSNGSTSNAQTSNVEVPSAESSDEEDFD